VLGLLVAGLTNPQIAAQLCISRSHGARARQLRFWTSWGRRIGAEAISVALAA
jgi:FixJ family two-component response regulator